MKKRPVWTRGSVAYIKLNTGKFAKVDACDASLVAQYNWCVLIPTQRDHPGPHYQYAVTNVCTGHRLPTGRLQFKMIYLHRMILEAHGAVISPLQQTDHRNGRGLDCRRTNLRVVDRRINGINKHSGWRSGQTPFRRVQLSRSQHTTKPYVGRIRLRNGNNKSKAFSTAAAAAEWSDRELIKQDGRHIEPDNLNFPHRYADYLAAERTAVLPKENSK